MALVLVIDDNQLNRKVVRDALNSASIAVEEAPDGPAGLRLLYERRPDAVLLDVLMPGMDGWTVCGRIRELSDVPIIMLTSLNREEEMVRGLNLGADDFVSKPVSPAQLVARVQAVLRRASRPAEPVVGFSYDDGQLRIDASRHEVTVGGRRVELTPTEFRLLVMLAERPAHVHTYAALLTAIWGPEYTSDIDFLRVYAWRLRKKLQDDTSHGGWIDNERGVGYRLRATGAQP